MRVLPASARRQVDIGAPWQVLGCAPGQRATRPAGSLRRTARHSSCSAACVHAFFNEIVPPGSGACHGEGMVFAHTALLQHAEGHLCVGGNFRKMQATVGRATKSSRFSGVRALPLSRLGVSRLRVWSPIVVCPRVVYALGVRFRLKSPCRRQPQTTELRPIRRPKQWNKYAAKISGQKQTRGQNI